MPTIDDIPDRDDAQHMTVNQAQWPPLIARQLAVLAQLEQAGPGRYNQAVWFLVNTKDNQSDECSPDGLHRWLRANDLDDCGYQACLLGHIVIAAAAAGCRVTDIDTGASWLGCAPSRFATTAMGADPNEEHANALRLVDRLIKETLTNGH